LVRPATCLEQIARLTAGDRKSPMVAMDLYVQNTLTREYQAYVELLVASRTDEELRAVFVPRARLFRQVWHGEMKRAFPEWEGKEDLMRLCNDLGTLVQDALLMNAQVLDSPAETAAVKNLVATVIRMVRDGEVKLEQAPKSRRRARASGKPSS
jgi:hypothetical protein